MKSILGLSLAGMILLGSGCLMSQTTSVSEPSAVELTKDVVSDVSEASLSPQVGLNFIRFYWGENEQPPLPGMQAPLDVTTHAVQPSAIFADFDELGGQIFRQLTKADVTWGNVEPKKGEWHFDAADAVLLRNSSSASAVVTLFNYQYASPTAPWMTGPGEFQTVVGPDAKTYVETVVERYKDVVKYWEIGNEMDHWRSADPTIAQPKMAQGSQIKQPKNVPAGGFTTAEQGVFFREVAAIIRAHDPEAVIVMPGMSHTDDYVINQWLPEILAETGPDTFDVITYHDYAPWPQMGRNRDRLQTVLDAYDLGSKPVWLTETGSSSDGDVVQHTNYPNSEVTQAADVFRRFSIAFAHGNASVLWHTYIGSSVEQSALWGEFGIRTPLANRKPALAAFRLFAEELTPFVSMKVVSEKRGQFIYTYTVGDVVKYVAWGNGEWTIPEQISQLTTVVSQQDDSYTWITVHPGDTYLLTETPILLK